MLGTKFKRPSDQLDYDLDFSEWLDEADTITSIETTVVPAGALTIPSTSIAGQIVKVWAAGGADGITYEINITALTSGGRIKEECFKIRVRDC